jgi:hypothetical protein
MESLGMSPSCLIPALDICRARRPRRALVRGAALAALSLLMSSASVSAMAAAASAPVQAAAQADPLLAGFRDPGEAARPRVWWHWMNGNVTWDGAKKDMDWMKRIGIAGLQAFDAGQATLQVVDKRLPYMSEGWKDVFRKTAAYADDNGLELAIAASPGWSETGGPWVTPQDGMKKMAWSETQVVGGRRFTGTLPPPPKTAGMLQTSIEGGILGGRAPGQNPPELYVDQKVVAFPVPQAALPSPTVTASGAALAAQDVAKLSDGDIQGRAVELKSAPDVGGLSWIQWDYGNPVTIRALTLSTPLWGTIYTGLEPALRNGNPPTKFRLEASDDGSAWRDTGAQVQTGLPERTISVDNVRARYFRFVSTRLPTAPPRALGRFERPQAPSPDAIPFNELVLSGAPKVHSFEEKAAFTGNSDYFALPSGTPGQAAAKPANIIDLTDRMKPDGSLDWTPPAGDWMVLRIGYSLTGAMNRPASPEATGLEVDKMNAAAVQRYMDHYLGMYRDATDGKIGKHGLRAMMFDSWEASYANWTPQVIADFKRLRGYDPTPWLPTLAGFVIDTPERSDAFLWDWRRTLQQLLKVNHYDQLTQTLHDVGMIRYGEAHEGVYATMGEGMEMKSSADIPMGAMWQEMTPGRLETGYFTDLTESASVAHIYGQNITAAESLTGGPQFGSAPWDVKSTADAILLAGVNRFVIHTSAHQPVDRGPGTTLGVGQFFTRNETWAEQAKPWVDYLSRSSFMLQQGQAVSDVAVFYGEAGPPVSKFREALPKVPAGYRFDFVNADVILNRLTPQDGALTTATGMRYRVLFLAPGSERITLPVLRKLQAFAMAGATLVGPRPQGSPSLADDPAAVKAVLDALWPGGSVASVGQGRVVASSDAGDGLAALGLARDFGYAKPAADSNVMFIHRRLADGEAYFVVNRVDRAEAIEGAFRVNGKTPELWDPATGLSKPVSYRIEGGVTHVTLPLDRFGSTFVVFRAPAVQAAVTVPIPVATTSMPISGPWQIRFQAERGAPASATFQALSDYRDNPDPGIRYFSGVATYARTLTAPRLRAGERLWLDLGQVNDLAEVWVNGKLAGTAWKPPYRVDVTGVAKPGQNQVEVRVVNKWVNRLIGDVQPGVTKKITFTAADGKVPEGMKPESFARSMRMPYAATAPLLPSGLIGPVALVTEGAP